ncbi:hypothetical protein AB6A40_002042 [Gnathostoma spinigerum]|uniref:F-box domain-containing protein n=1 Tax=Gnathostoma spinigerum TaxID=75299 RepID=A0ABD6E5R6_9BILA
MMELYMKEKLYEGKTFPIAEHYYTMTEAYRFIESSTRSLNMNYPLRELRDRRYTREIVYRTFGRELRRKAYLDTFDYDTPDVPGDSADHISKLPDVVLLRVFSRLHPLDYVHSLSLVCKRWNLLVQCGCLWRDVRVIASEQSLENGALKSFLSKMSNGIKRLCIDRTESVPVSLITEALPERMNTVTLLDMGGFDGLTIGLWEKLIDCFANLEILNLEYVNMIPLDADISALITVFFGEKAFRKIRHFICGYFYAASPSEPSAEELFLRSLWRWNRPLEVLHFCEGMERRHGIPNAPFATSLTVLHLSCILEEHDFLVVTALVNLRELFLSYLFATDSALVEMKKLSNLAHLHMYCCGQDGDFSDPGLAGFFELPEANRRNAFPSKLKYLKMTSCHGFQESAADALVRNCPALESLDISGNCYMGEDALSTIVKELRELRFLSISDFEDQMECNAVRNLRDEDLPCLKYLRLHRTKISEKVLRKLLLKRRNLIISPRPGHILTFTVHNGNPRFNVQFTANKNLLENDLLEQPGYCCI